MDMQIRIDIPSNSSAARSAKLGWPFLRLSPKVECISVSSSTSFFVSVLFGWWAYYAIVGLEIESSPAAILLLGAVAAVARFAMYCSGFGPSFNLWG